MSNPKVLARINYDGPDNPKQPVVTVIVNDEVIHHLKEYLAAEDFFVEHEDTDTLTVIAKKCMRRFEMTAQLIGTMKAWNDEYSGLVGIIHTLIIRCALPVFDPIRHTPSDDAPFVRVGTLKCKREVAVLIEDYKEAAKLQGEIDRLTPKPVRAVA